MVLQLINPGLMQSNTFDKAVNTIPLKPLLSKNLREFSGNASRTAQKTKFSINNFFSKCDKICSFLWNWLHLLKKSLM